MSPKRASRLPRRKKTYTSTVITPTASIGTSRDVGREATAQPRQGERGPEPRHAR